MLLHFAICKLFWNSDFIYTRMANSLNPNQFPMFCLALSGVQFFYMCHENGVKVCKQSQIFFIHCIFHFRLVPQPEHMFCVLIRAVLTIWLFLTPKCLTVRYRGIVTIIRAFLRENLSSEVCEQPKRRPACASSQSD